MAIGTFSAPDARAQDDEPPPPAAPPPAGAPARYIAPPEAPAPERERTANNAVFLELLGNGGVYSINYERFIGDFGVRAGFSYIAINGSTSSCVNGECEVRAKVSLLTIPVVGSYYWGSENHKLQLGAGLLVASYSGDASTDFGSDGSKGVAVAGTAVVGYRYMPRTGGFNFGVGFTPLIGNGGFLPWGGLSLGAVF